MTKRIFRSILAVALTVLLASLVLTVGVLHGYFQDRVSWELESRTGYIAHGVEQEGLDYLTGLPRDCRVTWVAADGTVLYDNWQDAAMMENHGQREEVREALELGKGRSSRYSDTLSEKTLYYALRLADGSVLRVSDTQYSVWRMVLQVLQPVALVMALAFCLALWLASRLARQLVAPINAIDLSDAEAVDGYEELSPLLGRIRSQSRQIRQQMEELKRQQKEFAAITENMSEGILIIDRETRVLSRNSAALRLLRGRSGEDGLGESVYALDREAPFRRCVEEALAGRRWEGLLEKEGCCRQIIASPVEQDGALVGAVLIIMDVTEKEQREQLRREFTANVSHELKTPLTAILGTAEILENGLVKPEDIPHFAGNIHREAGRLIGLVNDIIKLSRLDEGGPEGQWETVDLHALAEKVLDQVSAAAAGKHVALRLEGGPAVARGVPQILEEILYSLCDNAVAYNVEGGSVTVTVTDTPQGASVAVADTGIGIPREDQERVFERFYRVDKSHSAGGTGLGLSIVKHGAAYLGARVSLTSSPGHGSAFTVEFPKVEEQSE